MVAIPAQSDVEYCVARSGLGFQGLEFLLLARSSLGVCAVLPGSEPAALRTALHGHFPDATLHEGEASKTILSVLTAAIVARRPFSLSWRLDLGGTPFQNAVWEKLCTIPFGQTRSYSEVAALCGRSRFAARAVGQACAANRLALVIPCHRVVQCTDGPREGWHWGAVCKQTLLKWEAGIY